MIYPVIGVPLLGRNIFHRYIQYKYTRCLEQAGAAVMLLTLEPSEEMVEAALSKCTGFLFPGGPDIQPELYGQSPQISCGKPDLVRDDFERKLMGAALAARRPGFCIGRGMQLLNVVFGGTLVQELKGKQEYPHQDFFNRASATHPIELDPDSLVSQILGSDAVTVNSIHHQAADTIGEGLWIAADSPEGFPEALEIDDYPFCIAVQWHPEYMAAEVPVQQRLFKALVEACR